MPYDLICLGNMTIDDVILPDNTKEMGCFGGDAIYAALGASCWSDAAGFVAPVGADFPAEHLTKLQNSGWDLRGLPRRDIPNIRNWVIYKDNNNRTWIMESDPNDYFALSPTLEDIPADYLDSKAFMILAMDLASQATLAPLLRQRGLVAVDPQEDYITGNVERILNMLKDVDIYLPSQEEVFRILGHRDDEKACRQFAECGAGIVVIKMGSDGSLIFDSAKDRFYRIPVYPGKVVDTTGAGDAFCGGFMAMYVKSGNLIEAGLAGAVSASFAIEGFGLTHMFGLDRKEAERRLAYLKERL